MGCVSKGPELLARGFKRNFAVTLGRLFLDWEGGREVGFSPTMQVGGKQGALVSAMGTIWAGEQLSPRGWLFF